MAFAAVRKVGSVLVPEFVMPGLFVAGCAVEVLERYGHDEDGASTDFACISKYKPLAKKGE